MQAGHARRPRIEEIRANLLARIAEAERGGWAGQVGGLKVHLADAEEELAHLDDRAARTAVRLSIPSYRDIAGLAVTVTKKP